MSGDDNTTSFIKKLKKQLFFDKKYDVFFGLGMSNLSFNEYNTLLQDIKKLVTNINKIKKCNIYCELLSKKSRVDFDPPIKALNNDFEIINNSKNFIFYYPKKK